MPRKPARMYRRVIGQAYTRREYMGGVPQNRIAHYNMGDANGKFGVELKLKGKELCQIRHSALEAARVAAGRILLKGGTTNFHCKINIYPHHVLRENKVATGAGADRISQGMRRAFGKAIGTAARVEPGATLMTLRVDPVNFDRAKLALKKAAYKLPTPCRIVVTKGASLVK
jgi:large subunit ribosomal protein L10e